ncbi:hypothetical protein GE09DRAFT_1212560 [Coniochaeta sp. 2T2.1]|nr:hypothetical protein GE09DRAFT_1212560 [Coniochaeta sp. 2T2.1]
MSPPPKFRFVEPDCTSSDDENSDTGGSWFQPPHPPSDPNGPEQLRLTRRNNARLIAESNTVPQMDHPGQMPYCIWYPGFATEDTYRARARRYPALRYNVGRACAAGGFLDLYLELDLLPDVTIAEEARHTGVVNNSQQSSTAIFKHIMSQPVRYRVMDDYTLEDGQGPWVWANYFDITEDSPRGPDQERRPHEATSLGREFTYLLHSPLPRDLPTHRKDSLIVMAAYEGNVDRYARLRRPIMVDEEAEAVIHGIYHSTTFAKYMSLQEESPTRATSGDPRDLPHLIWHPFFPREQTLRELIRRLPSHVYLKESVALACIAADYARTYLSLEVRPTRRLWQQALKSGNRLYRDDLRRRAAEMKVDNAVGDNELYCEWYPQEGIDLYPTTNVLVPVKDSPGITGEYGSAVPYNRWELEANAAPWELYIAGTKETRDRADREADEYGCVVLYKGSEDWLAWQASLPWKQKEKVDGESNAGESGMVGAEVTQEEEEEEERVGQV